jgi:hypothetical protein
MVALLSTLRFVDDVITWSCPHHIQRGDWDQQIEVMELPRAFRTTLDTIPPANCFDIRKRAVPRLPVSDKPKIGLVWASSGWNPLRSLHFSALMPLVELEGLTFISFQRGPECSQLRGPVLDATEGAPDILDTAHDFLELDLLITVDTMAAHLAGALGIPVWTLLPHKADWRWMRDREDTPWYPSMRLFRQSSHDTSWSGVIARVRDALLQAFGAR